MSWEALMLRSNTETERQHHACRLAWLFSSPRGTRCILKSWNVKISLSNLCILSSKNSHIALSAGISGELSSLDACQLRTCVAPDDGKPTWIWIYMKTCLDGNLCHFIFRYQWHLLRFLRTCWGHAHVLGFHDVVDWGWIGSSTLLPPPLQVTDTRKSRHENMCWIDRCVYSAVI